MNAMDTVRRVLYQTANDDSQNSSSGMQLIGVDLGGGKLVAQTPLADYLELLAFDEEGGQLLAWLEIQTESGVGRKQNSAAAAATARDDDEHSAAPKRRMVRSGKPARPEAGWKTCLAEIDVATGKTGRSVACTTGYIANGGVAIARGGKVYSSLLTNSQPETPAWVTVDLKTGRLQATPTSDFAIDLAF